MKLKGFALFSAISLCLFSSIAHADILVKAPVLKNGNICKEITGNWAGSGTVIAKVLFEFTCKYDGKGVIYGSESGDIGLKITLHKTSGICPSDPPVLNLPGHCDAETGIITIKTESAELTANVSKEGRAADVKGKVMFNVPVIGDVTTKVQEMHLEKTN